MMKRIVKIIFPVVILFIVFFGNTIFSYCIKTFDLYGLKFNKSQNLNFRKQLINYERNHLRGNSVNLLFFPTCTSFCWNKWKPRLHNGFCDFLFGFVLVNGYYRKFFISYFGNIKICGIKCNLLQPHNFQMPVSPNANSAIWVMLDQHYTDGVWWLQQFLRSVEKLKER